MQTDYSLYYWPIPFRGHFIRYVLAFADADWEEPPTEDLLRLKTQDPGDQPVPFMAPPLLHDRQAGIHIAQLPAILAYLGSKHGLLPGDPERDALTHKIVGDANDVLEEVTRNCGARMWTRSAWEAFADGRLIRWLQIFEETGRRFGLTDTAGTILGTPQPTLADLATAALWHTMTDKLQPLAPLVESHAPAVAALSQRIAELPAIATMRRESDMRFGTSWCGGEIEASLREVTGAA